MTRASLPPRTSRKTLSYSEPFWLYPRVMTVPLAPFAPVPLRARQDGWTPDRQARFVQALGATRSVARAAAAVGLSRASAYRLRARADAQGFAAAWDAAFVPTPCPRSALAVAQARALWDRALNGRVTPVVRQGVRVGHRVKADDAALMTLMRRFNRPGRVRDMAPER